MVSTGGAQVGGRFSTLDPLGPRGGHQLLPRVPKHMGLCRVGVPSLMCRQPCSGVREVGLCGRSGSGELSRADMGRGAGCALGGASGRTAQTFTRSNRQSWAISAGGWGCPWVRPRLASGHLRDCTRGHGEGLAEKPPPGLVSVVRVMVTTPTCEGARQHEGSVRSLWPGGLAHARQSC